jgi:hypothetical protein
MIKQIDDGQWIFSASQVASCGKLAISPEKTTESFQIG